MKRESIRDRCGRVLQGLDALNRRWSRPLEGRHVRFSSLLGHALAISVLHLVFHALGGFSWAEVQLTRPLEFASRQALHLDPAVHESLKVMICDDACVASLGGRNLGLDEWADVLTKVAEQHPKAILIDKLFDMPSESPAEQSAFVGRIQRLDVPVYSAAFTSSRVVAGRALLPAPIQTADHPVERRFLYGAPDLLRAAFRGSWTIDYLGEGRFSPLSQISPKEAVPYLGLAAADHVLFEDGAIKVGETVLHTDRQGRALVNLMRSDGPRGWFAHSIGMKAVLSRARQGKPIDIVNSGDTVVIVPGMYTGSTDFVPTPLGIQPGGFVLASMANSVLRADFLREIEAPWGLGLAFLILGLAVGLYRRTVVFAALLLLGSAGIAVAGLLSFSTAGVALPWLEPFAVFCVTALSLFVRRVRGAQRERDRMSSELASAHFLQERIFPSSSLATAGLRVTGRNFNAEWGSGDWWSYREHADGTVTVLVADVTGHGTPSAFATAIVGAVFNDAVADAQVVGHEVIDPASLLAKLNRAMFQVFQGDLYATCFALRVNPGTGEVIFSNAGHEFPFVVRASESELAVSRLRIPNNPLGLDAVPNYKNHQTVLGLGDRIVLYTDGLQELVESQGKLRRIVGKFVGAPLEDVMATLAEPVDASRRNLKDDVTFVVVELAGKPAKEEGAAVPGRPSPFKSLVA